MNAESLGSMMRWSVALTVIVVSLVLKFFTKGVLSQSAILIGLLAGYALAYVLGMVNFGAVAKAFWITSIRPLPYRFEFSLGAVIAVTLVSIQSATTQAGAGRLRQTKRSLVCSVVCPTHHLARTSAS